MRRDRFARLGFGVLFGVALTTQSCSDPPGQLFGSAGRSSGGAGGKAAANGGTAGGSGEAGSDLQPTGGDDGAADGLGGASSQGGQGEFGGSPSKGGTQASTGGAGGISAGSGGALPQGGTGGAANGGKGGNSTIPSEVVQQIARNNDDCTWILANGAYEERLRYSAADPWVEVGSDTEQGRIGLRFVLPVPPKATIVSASLQLQRVAGNAPASNTLTIQVFDTGNVPSFDPSHQHGPRDHIGMPGLFNTAVRGTQVGERGKPITSADLTVLVQRVVDRADFVANTGSIGFVISPGSVREWVAYGDSSEGLGATLRVSYRAR